MSYVRSSKFRHVFGTEARKENCYEGMRPTNCAFEGYFIAANQKFVAYCVEVGGAGAFSVLPLDKTGRLDANVPKVTGHKEYVLDLRWNPFNDNMLATCSEDGSIKIWSFPDTGPLMNWDMDKSLVSFEYHQKRCVQISWHPFASNVLMSVSQEPKICIWNLDEGECQAEIECSSVIYNAEWSAKGDRIVASFKDKTFKVFDARSADEVASGKGHEGSKPQRVIFTFDDTMLYSTGFSKMSERQIGIWKVDGADIKELEIVELDTANGVLVPYYDSATQMVYVAAKGDSVIRYYEIVEEEPYYHYINTFQSKEPQRSLCHIPKRSVDVNACEIMKFYKLISSAKANMIKPISFTVPRKSDLFQDDLYPPAISDEAAIEPCEWFEGKDAEPKRVDMSTFFVGKKKPKGAVGGGLKKGGLKGLKAKKDAKEAAKNTETVAAAAVATPAPEKETKTPSVEPAEAPKVKSSPISSSSAPVGADPKVVQKLQDEIKTLKDNEKKMKQDLKSLTDKLKDYDKLTGDIKLLCEAVKKNDERLNALEALVQEESDDEGDK